MEKRRFALMICAGPYGSESSSLAYLFALEAVKRHRVEAIFFYEDGVLNSLKTVTPAGDEFDLVRAWQSLAREHGVRLVLCSAAGLRRGIVPETAEQGFEIGSLSDLSLLVVQGVRLVQFR